MKIERTNQTLTIKETPGCLWLFGLFFACVGATFVYGAAGGYSNFEQIQQYVLIAHMFMGVAAVAAGYWIIFKAPITRIIIDRSSETVSYSKRGIAGSSSANYRFEDIRGFTLVEDLDNDGDKIFALGLELADGELLNISALQSHDEQFKRDFVFQANEFMYKQMPSANEVFALEDETEA